MATINRFSRYIGAAALLALANPAQAVLIDFADLADNVLGEAGHQPLSLSYAEFDVGIYGAVSGDTTAAFAYLDAGNAGLGVCQALTGGNQCTPGSDDNVDKSGEELLFEFNTDVVIEAIWFNNNHDGDGSLLGDTISIFGSDYTFVLADFDGAMGWKYDTTTSVSAGVLTEFAAFKDNGEQFYVGSFQVPEPSLLGLLGIGLLGMGVATRRRS